MIDPKTKIPMMYITGKIFIPLSVNKNLFCNIPDVLKMPVNTSLPELKEKLCKICNERFKTDYTTEDCIVFYDGRPIKDYQLKKSDPNFSSGFGSFLDYKNLDIVSIFKKAKKTMGIRGDFINRSLVNKKKYCCNIPPFELPVNTPLQELKEKLCKIYNKEFKTNYTEEDLTIVHGGKPVTLLAQKSDPNFSLGFKHLLDKKIICDFNICDFNINCIFKKTLTKK